MKKLCSMMIVLVLVLSMAVSVSAATDRFVYDDADLLTAQEEATLSGRLSGLSGTYNAQIVVATIPSAQGNDVDTVLNYLYDNAGFGYGENLDGVLLLICMDPREYRILSNGYCAAAIDPADIDAIGSVIVDDLTDGNYCFMVGDSAGAMLALYAAAIQRNPKLARTAGIRPCYLEIRALGLISGMSYTTKLDPIGLVMPKVFYGPHYKKHPFYPYLNPNHEAVSMYLPPCLLTTSKHDNLRSYSYHMTAAIRLQEVPCILYDYGDDPELTHAFPVFAPEHPKSMEVIEDIASFFTNHK